MSAIYLYDYYNHVLFSDIKTNIVSKKMHMMKT